MLYPFCLFNQSYFNSPLVFCSTLKYPRRSLPPTPSTILIFTCLTWARTTLREASSASTNMCPGRGLISATQLNQLLLMGHIHLSLSLPPSLTLLQFRGLTSAIAGGRAGQSHSVRHQRLLPGDPRENDPGCGGHARTWDQSHQTRWPVQRYVASAVPRSGLSMPPGPLFFF